MSRGWVLEANQRYREAIPAFARACFLSPNEMMYARHSHLAVLDALYFLKHGKIAPRNKDGHSPQYSGVIDPFDLLPSKEVAQAYSISAHVHEMHGEHGVAKRLYIEACTADPENADLMADRERYMRKIQQPQRKQIGEFDLRRAQTIKQQAVGTIGRIAQPKGIAVTFTARKSPAGDTTQQKENAYV
jgi:hypothetical protein